MRRKTEERRGEEPGYLPSKFRFLTVRCLDIGVRCYVYTAGGSVLNGLPVTACALRNQTLKGKKI